MSMDAILVNGHEISFEIIKGEDGNNKIRALSDRTARILTVELDKFGRLVHSIEKGAKGTSLEKKAILGGVAMKETGPLTFENNRIGTFERYEQNGIAGRVVKNILNFDNGLEVEETNSLVGNNSNYIKKVNGVTAFSMTLTSDGIVLTRYDKEGNKLRDYSYDKNGKPIGDYVINFPGVPGYETVDSIDMNDSYMFADLILNDFVQDIGIPREMRNVVQNAEQTRYKELAIVREAMRVINENSRTMMDMKTTNWDER